MHTCIHVLVTAIQMHLAACHATESDGLMTAFDGSNLMNVPGAEDAQE